MIRNAIMVLGLVLLTGFAAMATDFPVTVSAIEVTGNVNITENQILKEVTFRAGDEINADDVKKAAQAIYDLGWFSEVIPEFHQDNVLTVDVKENPVVGEIEVTGNKSTEELRILGLTLFRSPIVSANKVRSILRENGVRKGEVVNRNSLKDGLQAVIDAYEKKGYTLIRIGDVGLGETLLIEIIEGKITDNVVKGLVTVSQEVAQDMIDLPEGDCVKKADIQRVISRLHQSVYFSDVKVVPQQGGAEDSVRLMWELTERKLIDSPIEVNRIELRGLNEFPADVANKAVGNIPQGPVDNYALLRVLKGVYDLYYRNGYVMIRFFVEEFADGCLIIKLDEGQIGATEITGNDNTDDYVIEKVLGIKEGEVLNSGRLAASYQRLMGLSYFETVNMNPVWDGDAVKLSVAVVEKQKLGGINGSLGFSPKSGGLVGKLSYSQKNLFGTGQDLSFSYNRGLINDKSATWSIGYSTVAFFAEFNRVGADLYRRTDKKTTDEDAELTVYTLGGTGSVSYPVADYTDLALAYKHEDVRTEGEVVSQPIDSFTVGVSYDTVNNPNFPTSGNRRSFSIEQAGGFAAGPDYTKFNISWVQFASLSINLPFLAERDQVFAVRLAVGWGERIPYSQAYDLGGPETIRGTSSIAVPRLAYANFEYRLAVVEGLTASIFFDVGTVLPRVNLSTTLSSFGIEMGISVAGVYVRLDAAWVIGPGMDWVPNFNFGFSPMF